MEEQGKLQKLERIERSRERERANRKEVESLLHMSEYERHDASRARQADGLAWLGVETKLRKQIREILEPTIEMISEEREAMFEINIH